MSWLKALFTQRSKRPQLVLWLGLAVLVLVVFTGVSTVGTSTNWFCTEPCHKVHDDNTLAYNESSHVMISCVACHEPLNGSPLTLVLMKIEVAPDLIPTVMNTYHLPMNENHSVAFEMPDEQCTQCHSLENRRVDTSAGLIMNHDVHAANEVRCTSCHNRVAHPEEDITLVLEGDKKHENWLGMDACFRCHGLEQDAAAPGTCSACHPAEFDLVPGTHDTPNWYAEFGDSSGHAAAASEEAARVTAAETWAGGLTQVKHEEGVMTPGYEQTVNTCYTCHEKQFCTNCHGVEMPHTAEFATDHGEAGLANPASCAKCHARSETEAQGDAFCNACHHPASTPDRPWLDQHYVPVREQGVDQCLDCHSPRYCSVCHVDGAEAAERYMREQSGQ